MLKLSLGICIGASTVSFVKAKEENGIISVLEHESITHDGNPKAGISKYFEKFNASEFSVVVTGHKFKELINSHSVSEPEAVETAIKFLGLNGAEKAIASLGSESFIVYHLNAKGNIDNVITGNKCASGTGEFFLQQISRMDLSLNETGDFSPEEKPYSVSGRCSVFCKSDCTHALNKGIPKGQVVSGLSQMIAEKTIELLSKQKAKDLLVIGGVSKNKNVIGFIKKKYPDLVIPKEAPYIEALGASIIALKKEHKLEDYGLFKSHKHSFPVLKSLNSNNNSVIFKELKRDSAKSGDECILGLDVGSTTTKAVIIRIADNAMLA